MLLNEEESGTVECGEAPVDLMSLKTETGKYFSSCGFLHLMLVL